VRYSRIPIAAIAFVASCDAPARSNLLTAPAQSSAARATASNEVVVFPLSATTTDDCAGGEFTFEGTIRQVYHETINGNHALFSIHETTSDMHGVGTDGTKYIISEGGMHDTQIDVTAGGGSGTSVGRFRVVSQGNGANFELQFTERVDIAANGEVTIKFFHDSTVCRG
jgi:hypothetical protein